LLLETRPYMFGISVRIDDVVHVGMCRGYAFVEFETKQAADEAARTMNLFDLGGQCLRVGRVRVTLFTNKCRFSASFTFPCDGCKLGLF